MAAVWIRVLGPAPRLRSAARVLRNQAHGSARGPGPGPLVAFATSAWGQGFAGEAAAAVATWVSRHLPSLPLIARVRPANLASQRVAIHAGPDRAQHLDTEGYDGFDWICIAQPTDSAPNGRDHPRDGIQAP
ncbi:GNAT family N-acetyltransferase [Streptomyces sp. NPDC048219]|uniref:GNAT family N-acetyltransferase n=1 Tax=Streptomyces sp. NPDC048219 TaxID=3365517 RepID=UPI00371FE427